jgi:hypothetical protein
MNLHVEELADESAHPIVDHQHGTILRIKNSKVEDSSQEIVVFAEALGPFFEFRGPLLLILLKRIPSIKTELKLVVAVVLKTKDTHEVDVEFVKMLEILPAMLRYPNGHIVHHAKRI